MSYKLCNNSEHSNVTQGEIIRQHSNQQVRVRVWLYSKHEFACIPIAAIHIFSTSLVGEKSYLWTVQAVSVCRMGPTFSQVNNKMSATKLWCWHLGDHCGLCHRDVYGFIFLNPIQPNPSAYWPNPIQSVLTANISTHIQSNPVFILSAKTSSNKFQNLISFVQLMLHVDS